MNKDTRKPEREAAGKDGTIKRIVEYFSPRETRIVALGKPSDRDRGSWYLRRYVPHLPAPAVVFRYSEISLNNGMIAE